MIIVIVQETGTATHGQVTVIGQSSTQVLQKEFYFSKAEFEQMWSTLNAPGVAKRLFSGKQFELSDYYVFEGGNQPTYTVEKAQSAPAISKLASRLRGYADAAMKSGAMSAVPVPHGAVQHKQYFDGKAQ